VLEIASPREDSCAIEVTDYDISQMPASTSWSRLGQVTVNGPGDLAANDPKVLRKAKEEACEMGGTAIALALAMTNKTATGAGSGITFVVLAPKD